ncbi:MAG: putative DNA-binding domain-containing protein [Acidobacteria bacterium]|nr:putative DNA-binding domain-containing protein [Acidobacteriota bacterium]
MDKENLQVGLERFQRWMSAAIMYKGTDNQALKSTEVEKELPWAEALKFIKPSKTLTQIERIGLYRSMYILRLVDVLKIDFPSIAAYLGDDDYYDFVERYLQVYPSRSYNLNNLSYDVPDFIKTAPKIKNRAFLYELASLELMLSHIFNVEETPLLTKEDVAAITAEVWETAKIIPIKAFHLFAFKHNTNAYLEAVQNEVKPPKVKKQDTWLAVYRRNYKLWRLPLSYDAYNMLSDIVAGKTLGDAIVNAIEKSSESQEVLQGQVFNWFQSWVKEGFFQKIETP